MDLKTLKDTPPWDWPATADKTLLAILRNGRADESDRLLAADLAGNFTVINDELADTLLSILRGSDETEKLRGQAAISLGPALEHADASGFEDPDDILISEETLRRTQESLRSLYLDAGVPMDVRRQILEAAVRAPQHWHQEAVRTAYSSDDENWKLTGVFCMRFIQGFDEQILEALSSENPDIHYQAVCAAGNWGIEGAWPQILKLVNSDDIDKPLLLAAIDAVASIRPEEAPDLLSEFTDSDDEDIADAAFEALAMAELPVEEDDYDDYGDDEDNHYLH